MLLSPAQLDLQSPVKIDYWVDINSKEWKDLEEVYVDEALSIKKVLKIGFEEPAFLFTDTLGRIWGKKESGQYYPLHFEAGWGTEKKLVGYRLAVKASN